jgi:hypothetical protein
MRLGKEKKVVFRLDVDSDATPKDYESTARSNILTKRRYSYFCEHEDTYGYQSRSLIPASAIRSLALINDIQHHFEK